MVERILIDAAHLKEEIRLVLMEDDFIKSFDYHNKEKNSIKGNIYLARVTRVEPSLQAAFIEYGGNRQGFLPLSEIHPDYYQIPKDDKDSLIQMILDEKQEKEESDEDAQDGDAIDNDPEGDDNNRPMFYKKYKIQEVLKKDQLLLVQVIKEERGTKGASLSTYISLAGRYCVLLPNSNSAAGGVSRKIDDQEERDRLKSVVKELSKTLEKSGSVIMRTAGAYKTKTEIKRDLSYLSRLWDNIRGHTMSSIAPTFIHEEGDIIKKAIRDLYNSDVEEIIVSGAEAYENAKNFTKLLLPKHIDKVKLYDDIMPLFSKYKIEEQLGKLYDNVVQLKSGGYIVINQTEALAAIDVNSGRATGEKSIENTAFKNNLEAAKEIARQVRLRDLSGLIVIDFIDMADHKNRKEIEKTLKDAFANDKARTQLGKISEFGLLELSRQRMRSSFSETSMLTCHHCTGRGKIRPVDVTAIAIIRAIESEIASNSYYEMQISCSKDVLLYILNQKCSDIAMLSDKHNVKINFAIDEEAGADNFFLDGVADAISSNKRSALSAIDGEPYVVEKESVEKKQKIKTEKILKNDVEKNNIPKKKKPEDAKLVDLKDGNKSNVNDSRRHDKSSDGEYTKQSQHRRKFRQRSQIHNDDPNINKVDNDTQPTSRVDSKNHSLLKEIWKKIVD